MARDWQVAIPPRSENDRVIAGVCGGLAARVGLDPVLVRLAVIILVVTGPGFPLYVIAWFVMPEGVGEVRGVDSNLKVETRRGIGLMLVVIASILTLRELSLSLPDAVVWPVVIVGLGVGVVLWQFQPRLESGRWDAVRIAAGVVVVAVGIIAFVAGNVSFGAVRDGVLAIVLVVGGLALILGPWMAVLVRDRANERHRRLQADARADMAAHLHDSVLQTFALMQRTEDPREMASLARQQERELRRWLYADSDDPSAVTLKSAVEQAGALVEDRHDITVETVVVGDAPLDSTVEALIGATGEAATNAAKWSGCDTVSVFVEVGDDDVHAYVRDTGSGFDPDDIADDRLGVRESIRGRMERVGGVAEIRSAPGEGTEVHLSVERPNGTV